MMLYPSMGEMVNKFGSPYALVNIAAGRARQISNDAENNNIHLEDKPVSMAIWQLYNGEFEPPKPDFETEE